MSRINTVSAEWMEISAWIDARLISARQRLETTGCDPRHADQLRGEIDVCKQLLDLPNKKEEPQINGSDEYIL